MAQSGFASRTVLLRQLAMSITVTVAATLILSGIQGEIGWLRGRIAQSAPVLTSGGKFAARVQALREAETEPTVLPPAPVLVAGLAFHALPVSFAQADSTDEAPFRAAPKVPRRIVHADIRRRFAADESHNVLPPRRGDGGEAATVSVLSGPSASIPVPQASGEDAWLMAKAVTRRTLALSVDALDKLNPLNLVP